MGRASRLRREAVRAGLLEPISPKYKPQQQQAPVKPLLLICHFCEHYVSASGVRSHIETCWNITLRPEEEVPMLNSREAVIRWVTKYKAREAKNALHSTKS